MDNNLFSLAHRRPLGTYIGNDLIADPAVHSDALKVTDSSDGFIKVGHVIGGREDCVDVNNHCSDLVIEAVLWEPRGLYLATIKGASKRITLRGPVVGHGKVVDVDLGNVSDQSDDLTRDIRLDLTNLNGEPITVRVLGSDRPTLLNSHLQEYKIVFELPRSSWVKSMFLKLYKALKKILPFM